MLGHVLGALVALFGLFGVGAVVSAIVWTLFAWSGRWYEGFSLSLPPWARINYDLRGLAARGGLGSPACKRSFGRLDRPAALHITLYGRVLRPAYVIRPI